MMAGCDGKIRQLLVIVGFHVALRVKSVCARVRTHLYSGSGPGIAG
jgi:hypothetical protein